MTAFIGRRRFMTLLGGGAASWPFAARAQQTEERFGASGFWRLGRPNAMQLIYSALKQALLDLDYVEGRNLATEYRSADGRAERFEELADNWFELNIDVILARGTPADLGSQEGKQDHSRRHDGERKPVHTSLPVLHAQAATLRG